ncbi:MAG: hypothetical protein ACRDN0_02100, partial [Trebonia sp.]
MPELYRPVLTPAGLKHPRVQEFLDIKRHPPGDSFQGAEGLALARKVIGLGAEGYEVSEKVLSRLAGRDGPDGIAALGQTRQRTLTDIRVGPGTRVMIADDWDLPGNLGTLIRCADGAGASAVL